MGAWVEAGIVGAIFWAVLFFQGIKALIVLPQISDPLIPLYAWILLDLLWSIPFSPFGAQCRLTVPLAILCIRFIQSAQKVKANYVFKEATV
jgi:hypothetical protein